MADRIAAGSTDATLVSQAYGAARELLRQAEEDAARIRADADRYRLQREQEAELLVAKARRLLTMAEVRAATLRPLVVAPDASAVTTYLDLDAPAPRDDADPGASDQAAPRLQNALDSMVATAVSNAVHRAMPSDR